MAQFNKNLFGSSFFGYSTTLDGYYTTPSIDADESFDGRIDISIKATTPSCRYLGNNKEWVPLPESTSWKVSGTEITSSKEGNSLSYFLCSDSITLTFNKTKSVGSIAVSLISPRDNSVVKTETVDTSKNSSYTITAPFQIYNLEIKQLDNNLIDLQYIDVRATVVGAEVRTSKDNNIWSDYQEVFLTYNTSKKIWTGSSSSVSAQQFVQAKIHLGTSDLDVSPIIDTIVLSSGDMNKRASDGWWMGAIDFTAASTQDKVTFKKAKRVEWKEECPEASYSEIRSTSTLNSMPSKTQVKDSTYWKKETAPYKVNRKDTSNVYGVPYHRISLVPNSNLADITSYSLDPLKYGLSYTANKGWLEWNDQTLYPLESNGTNVIYEFYTSSDDVQSGVLPVLRIENPKPGTNRKLSFPSEYRNHPFFVRMIINRTTGGQTPVIDYFDMYAQMQFNSPSNINSGKVNISSLDNYTGEADHVLIKTEQYPWPTNEQSLPENKEFLRNSTRTMTINYTPKFLGQTYLYFKTQKDKSNPTVLTSPATSMISSLLSSKVSADEPVASIIAPDGKRIIYHYSYDGGLVQYPNKSQRNSPVDFTPDLLEGRKYKYEVSQGWPDECFIIPYSMEWEEVSDIVGYSVKELSSLNPNVKLYSNKIPQGMQITLPNDSNNTDLNLTFQSTNSRLTEKSIWNGKDTDIIEAGIPVEPDQEAKDWVSEEKIYTGYINPNNKKSAYLRTQKIKNLSNPELTYIVKVGETYDSIAKDKNINAFDLQKANNDIELKTGLEINIPSGFNLPSIAESVYLEENPYKIELIPRTIMKNDGTILPDETITLGSDDEPVLQTTKTESDPVKVVLKRGSKSNKGDTIPYSNVVKIISVQNVSSGYSYQPYVKNGTSEVGDYILSENQVNWSPRHSNAKEPAAGEEYIVTFTYQTVDSIRIVMTSDYKERAGNDRLWRSEDVKVIDETVSPGETKYTELPTKNTFQGFNNLLKGTTYIIEDNDLWVQTSIEEKDGKYYLKSTMNDDNPKRNWHPEINTGYYYLGPQEYYLYSEPIKTIYDTKDIPIIKNTRNGDKGILAQKEVSNLFTNSTATALDSDKESIIAIM